MDREGQLVRRGICLIAIGGALLHASPAISMDGPAPVEHPWRLAMPYSCTVDRGAIVVQPGPERVFDITGQPEERLFTTCDPPFSNNCRSLTVHKFEVMCGQDRVSWPRVVAAIGRTTAGDAAVSKGHLVLVREAANAEGHAPSCADRKKAGMEAGECLPWRVRKPTERVVLPQGFAPLQEVGARLVDGSAPPAYAAADMMAVNPQPLSGSGPYRAAPIPAAGDFAQVQPLPAASTSPEAEHGAGWTTSLSFSSADEQAPELVIASLTDRENKAASAPAPVSEAPAMPFLIWLSALASLAMAAFYLYRTDRLRLAVPELTDVTAGALRSLQHVRGASQKAIEDLRGRFAVADVEEAPRAEIHDDPALASALLQLKAMLARTEAAVSTLSSSAVVREVMQSELAQIRVQYENAERAAHRGSTPVIKLAAQLRQIARDIDRVQKITESAFQSFTLQTGASPAESVSTLSRSHRDPGDRGR